MRKASRFHRPHILGGGETDKKEEIRGTWLAQQVEHVTLDLGS